MEDHIVHNDVLRDNSEHDESELVTEPPIGESGLASEPAK